MNNKKSDPNLSSTNLQCNTMDSVAPPNDSSLSSEALSQTSFEQLNNLRLLVVDDDLVMQEIVVSVLKSIGIISFEKASNGIQALTCLDDNEKNFDVIICDLEMPKMDGIELLRHLAERNYIGGIILMSGRDPRVLNSVSQLVHRHNLELLGMLIKPFEAINLTSMLKEYTGLIRSEESDKTSSSLLPLNEVRQAILADEISVFYQPKADLNTGKVVGVEALVRHDSEGRKPISPARFIEVAESSGLIQRVTRIVIDKAVRQLSIWRTDDLLLSLAINISLKDSNTFNWLEFIKACTKKLGLDMSNLILEITESSITENAVYDLEMLNRLRLMNVGLSIDDFGTGYSTFEKLKQMPFSELKIDREFVTKGASNTETRAIAKSSVALAKELGLRVVAEGVETIEDWEYVRAIGCDHAQGYFISKPLAGSDIQKSIVEWHKKYNDL